MQNHTGSLVRALDGLGVEQVVLTTRPPTAPRLQRMGRDAVVHRVGLPVPVARQGFAALAAVRAPRLAAGADLVHAHLGVDLGVLPVARATAALHRVPLVVTVHTSMRHTFSEPGVRAALLKAVGGRIEEFTERRADHVIALTDRLADLLVGSGVPGERVSVIPSGVVPGLFDAAAPDPYAHLPRPRVVFVGRLHPQKGVPTLLEAAARLRTPGAHLLLVGDGPERGAAERLAAKLGLSGRVTFAGAVAHDLVPSVLAGADVVVVPSIHEELGSIVLETMQAGRPLVASNTGGIPTAVRDGVEGLLVPPGDAASLAAAVDRVLGDRALADRLATAARLRGKDYDWAVLAERVRDVYEHVVSTRVAARR
jgi:glycosyltransferase involved in cell wall biosynthesis